MTTDETNPPDPGTFDNAMVSGLLRIAFDPARRPVDHLIERLQQADAPEWFKGALARGTLADAGDPQALLIAGEADATRLDELKDQAKAEFAQAGDANDRSVEAGAGEPTDVLEGSEGVIDLHEATVPALRHPTAHAPGGTGNGGMGQVVVSVELFAAERNKPGSRAESAGVGVDGARGAGLHQLTAGGLSQLCCGEDHGVS